MFCFIIEEEYAKCFVDSCSLCGMLYGSFSFGEEGEDGLEELLLFFGVFCFLIWKSSS